MRARTTPLAAASLLLMLLLAMPLRVDAAPTPTPAAAAASTGPLAAAEVAPGVFVHTGAVEDWLPASGGDVANLSFVVGSRCVAVIDTGGTPALGQRWKAAVARATQLPVCYVVATHAHPDHVLGGAAFAGPGTQFVGSAKFNAALGARESFFLNALSRDFGIRATHADVVYRFTLTDGLPPREDRVNVMFVGDGGETLQMKHHGTGQVFATADVLSEFLLVPVLTGRPR